MFSLFLSAPGFFALCYPFIRSTAVFESQMADADTVSAVQDALRDVKVVFFDEFSVFVMPQRSIYPEMLVSFHGFFL